MIENEENTIYTKLMYGKLLDLNLAKWVLKLDGTLELIITISSLHIMIRNQSREEFKD